MAFRKLTCRTGEEAHIGLRMPPVRSDGLDVQATMMPAAVKARYVRVLSIFITTGVNVGVRR